MVPGKPSGEEGALEAGEAAFAADEALSLARSEVKWGLLEESLERKAESMKDAEEAAKEEEVGKRLQALLLSKTVSTVIVHRLSGIYKDG